MLQHFTNGAYQPNQACEDEITFHSRDSSFFKYFGSGGCKLQRGLGDPASQQALLLRDMSSEKLEILVRLDKSTISSSSSAGSGKSEAQLQTLLFSVR